MVTSGVVKCQILARRSQVQHVHSAGLPRPSLVPVKCSRDQIHACAGRSRWVETSLCSDIRPMLVAPLALMATLALSLAPHATAETLYGSARVVDGDTLEMGRDRVRLFGIDAPESKQLCKNNKGQDYACGEEARVALERKIAGGPVKCDVKNQDMYGRSVSVCYGQSNEDLNGWMVSQGEAVAYTEYSKQYLPLAQAAEASKKGIWNGEFETPSKWRKENPRGGGKSSVDGTMVSTKPTTEAPNKSCAIKGNINSSGEKIFHVPGGRYYDNTVIDVAGGEKWFCSSQEAEKAGWRASKA